MEDCVRRCLWARPGGDVHHLCPHPIGQNQAMALPRCKEGWGTQSLAWQPLRSNLSSLGSGQNSLVNIALSARGGQGPVGH